MLKLLNFGKAKMEIYARPGRVRRQPMVTSLSLPFTVRFASQPGPVRASCSSLHYCEFSCIQKQIVTLVGLPPFL